MNEEVKNTQSNPVTKRLKALASLGFGQRPNRQGASTATLGVPTNEIAALDLSDPDQRKLGDYELLEEIGRGGMGVVYRARQNSLGREVAVKILAAGPWASTSFTERFRQEAQSAARMQHPNIVAIHEIGEADGISFFSMQYVRGNNLHRRLAAGLAPKNPIDIARLIKTLADAVHYAHQLNVLHLDLKPANVLIADEHERPFIADFGLARPLDHAMAAATDEVSGTPSYMAPEQAELRGHALSRATDIYGLGSILYELLTKRPPHLGESPEETMRLVVRGDLMAPRKIDRMIPVDLEAVCVKCLSRDPSDRYSSAQILADDLARFIDGNPVSIRRPNLLDRLAKWYRRKQFSRWAVAGSLAALLAVLIAVGFAQLTRRNFDQSNQAIGEGIARVTSLESATHDEFGIEPLIWSISESWTLEVDQKEQIFRSMSDMYEKQGGHEAARVMAIHREFWRYQQSIDEWVAAMRALHSVEGDIAAAYVNVSGREPWNAFSPYVEPIRYSGASKEFGQKAPGFISYLLKLRTTTEAIDRVISSAGDDAEVLRMIAPLCNLPWQFTCDAESMYQRLGTLDPNNLANWVSVAPQRIVSEYEDDVLGLPLESVVDRMDRSKLRWHGVEGRLYAAISSSVTAIAPRFVRDERTTPEQVANFIALTQFASLIDFDAAWIRYRCRAASRAGPYSREWCDISLSLLDPDVKKQISLGRKLSSDEKKAMKLFFSWGRYESSGQLAEDVLTFGYDEASKRLLSRYQAKNLTTVGPSVKPSP